MAASQYPVAASEGSGRSASRGSAPEGSPAEAALAATGGMPPPGRASLHDGAPAVLVAPQASSA
eukprot:4545261-Heterocapsa_arctica.AAC.1